MRVIFQLRGVDVQPVRGRHYQAQGELLEKVRLSIQPHVEISGFQVGNKHENEFFSALFSEGASTSGLDNVFN